MRGLVNAGALEAVEVEADRPLDVPDPDFAPPELNAEQAAAAASLTARDRQGLRPGPARRGHRLGQDRSLFRGDRRSVAAGQAGARPAPRNRADRAVPQALPGALRLAPRSPGTRDLRSSQRRRAWRAIASGEAKVVVGARSALFLPYAESRPDRRRRGARAELQAGRRRPISRPRRRGDARPSSRTSR